MFAKSLRSFAIISILAGAPIHSALAQESSFDPEKVDHTEIPLDLFKVPEGLEVTLWAGSPMLLNPTNIDIDKEGRIWVAEGVRYRKNHGRRPEGDRIVVLEDTNGDGKADSSHLFVQEPGLVAPLAQEFRDSLCRRTRRGGRRHDLPDNRTRQDPGDERK
jgi:hypothetical protein